MQPTLSMIKHIYIYIFDYKPYPISFNYRYSSQAQVTSCIFHGHQGYWPESLLTPPDAAAVERDLRAIKARPSRLHLKTRCWDDFQKRTSCYFSKPTSIHSFFMTIFLSIHSWCLVYFCIRYCLVWDGMGIARCHICHGHQACGFNTVRVHAVVMDANFYSLCDQLGLMVWQADVEWNWNRNPGPGTLQQPKSVW